MDLEAQAALQLARRKRLAILISIIVAQLTYYYHILFHNQMAPIPFHTAILTGQVWIMELLNGHLDRIRLCLGVSHDVFDALVHILQQHSHGTSLNGITVEEQLGIFLYTCVTGLSSRHVAERFQHLPTMITK